MTMYARIVESEIRELIDFDPEGYFHPDLVWKPVPENLQPWNTQGWRVSGKSFAPPLRDEFLAVIRSKIAARRWEVLTGGMMLGGTLIRTDPATQADLTAARSAAGDAITAGNGDTVIDWKLGDGTWVRLSATRIEAMFQAMLGAGGFKQQCFSREKAIDDAVTTARTTAAMTTAYAREIDLFANDDDPGWPAASSLNPAHIAAPANITEEET